MKKVLLSLSLGLLVLTVSSCKKDKAVNCEEAAKQFTDAYAKYYADDSKANCDALNVAFNNYVNGECGSGMTAEEKAQASQMFDGNCD